MPSISDIIDYLSQYKNPDEVEVVKTAIDFQGEGPFLALDSFFECIEREQSQAEAREKLEKERSEKAEAVFSAYDFGCDVEAVSGWQQDEPGAVWTRVVFLNAEAGDGPSLRGVFQVMFDGEQSSKITDAVAYIDGDEIGDRESIASFVEKTEYQASENLIRALQGLYDYVLAGDKDDSEREFQVLTQAEGVLKDFPIASPGALTNPNAGGSAQTTKAS